MHIIYIYNTHTHTVFCIPVYMYIVCVYAFIYILYISPIHTRTHIGSAVPIHTDSAGAFRSTPHCSVHYTYYTYIIRPYALLYNILCIHRHRYHLFVFNRLHRFIIRRLYPSSLWFSPSPPLTLSRHCSAKVYSSDFYTIKWRRDHRVYTYNYVLYSLCYNSTTRIRQF